MRGLELVVELFAHAGPQLVDEGLGVETLQHHRREHRVHHLGGVEVALDRLVDARVLDLDRDVEPVVGDRPVDLADAGRGDRQVGPVEEYPLGWIAELGGHHAGRERRRHRRGVGLQRGERGLRVVGQRLEDEADELTGLHQHALHLAELLGDVLGGADRELLVELGAALGGRADAPDLLTAKRAELRADSFHTRADRLKRLVSGDRDAASSPWRPPPDPAAKAASDASDTNCDRALSRGATGDGVAFEELVGDRMTVSSSVQ